MIVVFASAFDLAAKALVARWKDHDASLLTCDDLSIAGWRHYLPPSAKSIGVVQGHTVAVEDVAGVLIRWPAVFPQELTHIAAADREYVAAEMTAFLMSFLSTLKCPVINRPTPLNLSGPAWRQQQWTHVASRLGIPVHPTRRRLLSSLHQEVPEPVPSPTATVTVVGDSCFGSGESTLCAKAKQLAKAAGVVLAQVEFCGEELIAVNLIPEISEHVADAVLSLLLTRTSGAAHTL